MSHMNPGATVIGLIFKDGVMLAADKRFTYGGFITAKNVKKTFKISDKTGSACAGLVSDMQELMKELTGDAECWFVDDEQTFDGPGFIIEGEEFRVDYRFETLVGDMWQDKLSEVNGVLFENE